MHRQLVTFSSSTFQLTATIDLPSGDSTKKYPAVLFCHGFTGNRIESYRSYARLGAELSARGIGSFRFDHRGCGESSGDFIDFTAHGIIEDLDAALATFLNQPEFNLERTAVVGYSLGGASASYLLQKRCDFLTAVLWAPVSEAGIIRERYQKNPTFDGYRERGYYDNGGYRVSASYLDEVGRVMRPLQWIREYQRPLLFIHGADDDIVSPEHTENFLNARKNAADKKILIDGANHSFSTAANFDVVIARTADHLSDVLL